MNKIKSSMLGFVVGLTCTSIAYAGAMGPVSSNIVSYPYVGLEGAYTWNGIKIYNIDTYSSSLSKQQWGGRLSAGMVRTYSERVRFNAEIGGGYYGSLKVRIPAAGISTNVALDGYDVLVGGLYNISQFDLFADIGFMAQNNRSNSTKNLARTFPPGTFINGTFQSNTSVTQVLPQIKVGSIYNFNENLGITLSYLHVFGSAFYSNVSLDAVPGNITISGVQKAQNPYLDSILLGVRYYIV